MTENYTLAIGSLAMASAIAVLNDHDEAGITPAAIAMSLTLLGACLAIGETIRIAVEA